MLIMVVFVSVVEARKEFLQLDHINNDGAAHRKQFGPDLIKWAYLNACPKGLQVLCANCNWAKRFGICSHQKK